jgi:hypothetical protein
LPRCAGPDGTTSQCSLGDCIDELVEHELTAVELMQFD